MKKKYRVDIHRYGALNNTITMMVANHNDGISSFNLMDVVGLVNSLRCALPLSNQGFCHLWNSNNPEGTSILISENGGHTYTLTITQISIHPLNNVVDIAEKTNIE